MRVIILDFRAVSDIDVSGAVTLQQISARLARNGRRLFFSDLKNTLVLNEFTSQRDGPSVFPDLDAALERYEQEIVERTDSSARSVIDVPLERTDFGMTMDPADLKALIGYLNHVELPGGTVLCRTGDPTDRLWMLTRGSISIWVSTPGGRRRLASIGAGCTVGEMGLLTDRPRSTDVIADEDVMAYELTSSAFNEIVRSRPHIAQAVLRSIARQLSDRLRDATEDLRLSRA